MVTHKEYDVAVKMHLWPCHECTLHIDKSVH